MKIKITISEEEITAVIADHLAKKFGFPIIAEDLTFGGSYDHSLVLGKYDSYDFPPNPPKPIPPPAPPVEPVVEAAEPEVKSAETPF